MDAGSSSIEIKIKEYGTDYIEIIDNGKGISEEDYESVALKHHTSKISTYDDLESVKTFGFRGEALNALCELCGEFWISTKQESQRIGNCLTFQRNGRYYTPLTHVSNDRCSLKTKKLMSRPTGTTVHVERLFEPLPVRRAEFLRYVHVP